MKMTKKYRNETIAYILVLLGFITMWVYVIKCGL